MTYRKIDYEDVLKRAREFRRQHPEQFNAKTLAKVLKVSSQTVSRIYMRVLREDFRNEKNMH